MAADAELKQLKQKLGKELEQAKEESIERLEQAQATAEQRVEQHTEGLQTAGAHACHSLV